MFSLALDERSTKCPTCKQTKRMSWLLTLGKKFAAAVIGKRAKRYKPWPFGKLFGSHGMFYVAKCLGEGGEHKLTLGGFVNI